MLLGSGTYGKVVAQDGKAVKTFAKLSHLVQEYAALKYMNGCSYVVQCKGVNFAKLELQMELYDGSLRKWMQDKHEVTTKILHDIIMGLVEVHDRKLAHGDLKPGNILVRKQPLKAVLGDCGFVSIDKYAKVDCTASMYRDPKFMYDAKHDMYSLGIILLEIMSKKGIKEGTNYDELNNISKERIVHDNWRKVILSLVQEDRHRRPTARELLKVLYKEDPPKWNYTPIKVGVTSHRDRVIVNNVTSKMRQEIQSTIKHLTREYDLKRGQKGYGALVSYLEQHNIVHNYSPHVLVSAFIISALFSKNRFKERKLLTTYGDDINSELLHKLLEQLLSDKTFLNILLHP